MTSTFAPAASRQIEIKVLLTLFAATALFYLAFSPATIEGMGYYGENLNAADQLLSNLSNLLHQQPLTKASWTRHGGLELLFELPFVLLSRLFFGASVKWAGRVLALQPILATSLIVTLMFAWACRLTGNYRRSLLLALVAAFTTLLWPYAYIGLETTQSACLLTAGYFALGRKPRHTWGEVLSFSGCCVTALAVKSTGLFLLPSLAYLIFCYFSAEGIKSRISKLAFLLSIIAGVFVVNALLKESYFSNNLGSSVAFFSSLLVDGPLVALSQAISFFGSANKSLLIYAPVTALCLLKLPSAFRQSPALTIFAVLTLGGLVAGFSLVNVWSEETWGPRYLHSAIAPLLVCLAAAWQTKPAEESLKEKISLFATIALGLFVTLPGVLIPYTSLHQAMTRSERATLPALQYDPIFNHVRFNYLLLRIWLKAPDAPVSWPPAPLWWFEKPVDAVAKTVDLREWASPQPAMLRAWTPAMSVSPKQHFLLRLLLGGCLCLSLALFFRLIKPAAISVSGRYE
ncbi:MAG TPA: hypothetical protein PKC13_08415 [Blastocatellia bacterium]|nr:hypothetical protein [Blastocatellia bacterium]HMV86769.1 hypothetical protein [Blastocatellia bacterium]HMX25643.1 hypothetical protein [Blastocatellia bacterium]HMY71170.1 hypothetical protein [Blastocatellia bacterium]HNG31471.1 hypothetical protein [Blastocatellia bacterium]